MGWFCELLFIWVEGILLFGFGLELFWFVGLGAGDGDGGGGGLWFVGGLVGGFGLDILIILGG